MNQWTFVIAAYVVTAIGTGLVTTLSWRAMRSAEQAAEHVSDRS